MIISNIKKNISNKLQKAGGLPSDFIFNVDLPPEKDMGDICVSCFRAAKILQKNPVQIAEKIVKNFKKEDLVESIENKGAYINIFLSKESFQKIVKDVLKKQDDFGKQKDQEKKVLIEFSSPNTNKPQHLGHLRNNFLGWSMSKIFEKLGFKAIKINAINDRGIHICKSMLAYKKWGNNESPQDQDIKPDHFVGDYYVLFDKKAEKEPELLKQAQEMLIKWEKGDKETIKLWQKMRKWTLKGLKETYNEIGVSFDKWYWESEIYKQGKQIIQNALKKGLCYKREDKAIEIDLTDYNLDKKVLLRPDGTSVYISYDLALAKKKQQDFKPDLSMYVVGSGQEYHFKVLFRILEKFGLFKAKDLFHLSYGMIDLPEGKMKSRKGRVVEADELINEMTNLAKKEIEKRDKNVIKKEIDKRAKKIALSAIKFYLLKFTPKQRFTFKPKESLSFEGDTGPYLLYTYARIKSILKKSHLKVETKKIAQVNWSRIGRAEKETLKIIFDFPNILKKSKKELNPTYIATYLLGLAHEFNEFYHKKKVIQEDKELERLRLFIILAVSIALKSGLDILGIETIEKM
ncbi:MAG TPA: arginine--tRNA ligase [Patescibacteria group bacterium]|nr:arginine--tRNA ligase [Patescibacteria group bacterium]